MTYGKDRRNKTVFRCRRNKCSTDHVHQNEYYGDKNS